MKKVRIDYQLILDPSIKYIEIFMFEKHDERPNLKANEVSQNPPISQGTIEEVLVFDKLEILVRVYGKKEGAIWKLKVWANGKKLTKRPISKSIKMNGISTYFHSHNLPK